MPDQEVDTIDILALNQRAHNRQRIERVGSTAVGLFLAGAAAARSRPVTRVLLGTAGALLIARGLSGMSVQQLSTYVTRLFSNRADLERRFNDGEHDIVDAASFDSFPASDPPSYSPGVG